MSAHFFFFVYTFCQGVRARVYISMYVYAVCVLLCTYVHIYACKYMYINKYVYVMCMAGHFTIKTSAHRND